MPLHAGAETTAAEVFNDLIVPKGIVNNKSSQKVIKTENE
jgi:hypothetical protein